MHGSLNVKKFQGHFLPGYIFHGMELTTHFHPASRLEMRAALLPLPRMPSCYAPAKLYHHLFQDITPFLA